MKKEVKDLLKYLKKTNNSKFKKLYKLADTYKSAIAVRAEEPESSQDLSMEIDLYGLAALVFEDKFEFPVFRSKFVGVKKNQEDE